MHRFPCPYPGDEVELTEEREQHVTARHPDLLPEHRDRLLPTLADLDQVRRSPRFGNARLFSRWYDELRGGKHVMVVVISAPAVGRHWIVTAYIARTVVAGDVEWQRS